MASYAGTINLALRGVPCSDEPAETITKVRIWRDGDGFDLPFVWHLDGVNTAPDAWELSRDVADFKSLADAVAAIPAWLRENGYDL